jgi:hypothetical protein
VLGARVELAHVHYAHCASSMTDTLLPRPPSTARRDSTESHLIELRNRCKGSDSASQCSRLLLALERSAITTFEAMRFLDVYHVPARVLQLRRRGHNIVTHWCTVETESGERHRVGMYELKGKSM